MWARTVPDLQIAWDSTSLQEFQKCPKRYYFRIISGWAPRKEPVELGFGIIYHKAMETFEKSIALGTPFEEAQRLAFDVALSEGRKRIWLDNNRNTYTLVRSVIWNTEHFRHNPPGETVMLDGRPAVELSFRLELDLVTPDGDPYLLCGHLDSLINCPDGMWIRERKTTIKTLGDGYYKQFSPNTQISLYYTGGQVALRQKIQGVLIEAAQVMVDGTRFGVWPAHRSTSQLSEFLRHVKRWILFAEECAEKKEWPMNEAMCWACKFQPICKMEPKSRKTFLPSEYVKSHWNPLDNR